MTKKRFRILLANVLLAIAYIFVTLQWLWILLVGLPPLIDAGVFNSLSPPAQINEPSTSSSNEISPALAIVAGTVTILFLLLTIIIVIKLPKHISHTGETIVQKATEAVIPVITHHQKIPAKKKRALSRRVMRTIQVTLAMLPLLISLFIPSIETITSQIIATLAFWLAVISIVCFVCSWLLQPTTTILRTQSHVSRE